MLNITNQKLLKAIAAESVRMTHYTSISETLRDKWIRAIAKGTAMLEGDTTFMHWDRTNKTLLFWSDGSNEIYTIGKECQCKAFANGAPCYHRAMRRLVEQYYDRLEKFSRVSQPSRAAKKEAALV